MASVIKLNELIRKIKADLAVCKRCGICQATCPVYAQTGLESDVARGKLALLDGLEKDIFKNPNGVLKRLNRCLLCGSCEINCPRKVNVLEIFIKARIIITDFTGLSLWKKIILRWCLAYPERFDYIIKIISQFQSLFIKPAEKQMGTFRVRFFSPFFRNRHFIPLSTIPVSTIPDYHKIITLEPKFENCINRPVFLNEIIAHNRKSQIKVAFFSGCIIRKIMPNIIKASIDVLNFHNVSVVLPESEGCCGLPAIAAGDQITFDKLIKYNLEKFEALNFDYLITSCATCTFAIKKIWPMMTRNSKKEQAKTADLAEKTMDINQFLVSKVELKKIQLKSIAPVPVTYHDPCHLKKSLGIASEPREVIGANKNYKLKEMENADLCCGFGGSFNLQYYDMSEAIGKNKQDYIRATGCKVVASGCPACIMQITDVFSKAKENILVKHPVEIYRESID